MKNQNPTPRKNDVNIDKNQTNTPNRKPTDIGKQKPEKEFDTLNPDPDLTKTGIQNNGKNDARASGPKNETIDRDEEYEEDEEETEAQPKKPIGNKTTPTDKR